MNDPAVVNVVLSELRSGSTAARGEMFMLLQLTDNEYTTDALISLLDDDRWSGDAAYALALRGNPVGRDELQRAIDEEHDPSRIRELQGALSIITSASGE